MIGGHVYIRQVPGSTKLYYFTSFLCSKCLVIWGVSRSEDGRGNWRAEVREERIAQGLELGRLYWLAVLLCLARFELRKFL
jgi:hypothetical protein